MNEMLEERTSEKPEWLELPERSSYWSTYGSEIAPPKKKWWKRKEIVEEVGTWLCMFYTQEDAEAWSAKTTGKLGWVWDKNPAHETTLAKVMRVARINGKEGVIIRSFRDGKWRCVKKYPAGEPLPMEEQG